MNKKLLEAVACVDGAILEQDDASTYQAVAPDGFAWVESDSCHICIHWDIPEDRTPVIADAVRRIKVGIRPMTDDERFIAEQ